MWPAALVDDLGRYQLRLITMEQAFTIPDPENPAEALAAVVALRRLADRLELAAVQAALDDGWSYLRKH